MNNTESKKKPQPSRGRKTIGIPFTSEAQYQQCLEEVARYRSYLTQVSLRHPELFPQAWRQGYRFHDRYRVRKQPVTLRRIKLTRTAEVFTLRPSWLMPYGVARTAEVEKALYLRQWGVPCEALAYGLGHNAMYWERAWRSLGRPNLVGTTVKTLTRMPLDLVADEKITWLAGKEVGVPTTVGGGCVLGIRVATEATSLALQAAYGEFKTEATTVVPDYAPRSVCTDGFAATRDAGRQLFPRSLLVSCFWHAILKLRERWRGPLRHQVLERAWHVYHAGTQAQFAHRLRRLAEWARTTLEGSLAQTVAKIARLRDAFTPA